MYRIIYYDTTTQTRKSVGCPRRHVLSTSDLIGQAHRVLALLPPTSTLTLDTINTASLAAQDRLDPDVGLTSPPARIAWVDLGDLVVIRQSPSIWAEGQVLAAENTAQPEADEDDWYIELNVTAGTVPQGYMYWKQLQDGGSVTLTHRADEDTQTATPPAPTPSTHTQEEKE